MGWNIVIFRTNRGPHEARGDVARRWRRNYRARFVFSGSPYLFAIIFLEFRKSEIRKEEP